MTLSRSILARRRGFTFVEVMFAVIILGIGFIMIAGVFPIALQQTQRVRADAASTALGRSATQWLQQAATNQMFPYDSGNTINGPDGNFISGVNVAFGPPRRLPKGGEQPWETPWARVRNALISSADPHFAWTPIYFRADAGPRADVFIFACESPLDASFAFEDIATRSGEGGSAFPNLYPRPVQVVELEPADMRANPPRATDQITFSAQGPRYQSDAVAPGSFVVVYHPTLKRPVVYRLGNAFDAANNIWELSPGYGLASAAEAFKVSPGQEAYVVGSPWHPNPVNAFSGPTQDIAVYQTSVLLK